MKEHTSNSLARKLKELPARPWLWFTCELSFTFFWTQEEIEFPSEKNDSAIITILS